MVRLSQEELLTRVLNYEFPGATVPTVLNEAGDTLTQDSLQRITDPTQYALDYYADSSGAVVHGVLRTATEADRAFQQQLATAVNEGPEPQRVPIDCADKVNILQSIFDRDQEIRGPKPYDRQVDHENLATIISYLDRCGVPSRTEVDEAQMAGIWAVLQHNALRYRLQYLPLLERAAAQGDLAWGVIATMRDRNLMDQGLPQLYGTQQVRNAQTGEWELYELADPNSVDARRAEMGMGAL